MELPANIPARSVFGARCTDFCDWNNGALCPNSGIPARTLIFSFRSGVAFGGRGTAGGCFVTPCQGVFLSCGLVCVPGAIACQTLDFFIRFRSDVWPGQRDGRRLFRHAAPGCFPDLKVVCLEQLPARPLIDFFIRFRSDVWPGQRDGRRLFRHAVPGCFPDLKGVLWLVLCAWNNCLPDPLARAEGRQEAVSSRRARVFS